MPEREMGLSVGPGGSRVFQGVGVEARGFWA